MQFLTALKIENGQENYNLLKNPFNACMGVLKIAIHPG
jgi:hypothetical protein